MSRIRRGPCDRSLTPSSSLQTLAQRGDVPQTHFFLMPAHWHSTRTVYVYLVTIFDSSGDTVYHHSRFVQRKRISLVLLRTTTTLYGSSSHLVSVRRQYRIQAFNAETIHYHIYSTNHSRFLLDNAEET